jgi:hypothetical protein
VAASDLRVSLDPGEVEAFVKAVEAAYGNLLEALEMTGGREPNIDRGLVEKVNATMRNLDDLAIRRLKKLD